MKYHFAALVSAALLALTATVQAKTIKVGVVPGVYADSIEALIPEAKAKGLDVEVVEFSDWTTPNVALDAGDIDVNFFQHKPFLENAIEADGLRVRAGRHRHPAEHRPVFAEAQELRRDPECARSRSPTIR